MVACVNDGRKRGFSARDGPRIVVLYIHPRYLVDKHRNH